MKMYSDYHVHTYYSDDSTYLMENVIKGANNKRNWTKFVLRSCGLWNQKGLG